MGFDVTSTGAEPIPVRATLDQFDYQGNLRFNMTTGAAQLYAKYGTGITRYQLKNMTVNGDRMFTPDSPVFKPAGNWLALGFNELLLGAGLDIAPVKVWRTWLGAKIGYTAIHHKFGFEKELAVELDPDLAKELAGTTFSVWRHQFVIQGSVSF